MYLSELEFQCEFALRAFGEMQHAYSIDPNHPSLLALAHTLLIFSGNVAKLLTAPDNAPVSVRARAARLSTALGLDAPDFTAIRAARNYFEHFDERMDRYLADHTGMLVHRRVQTYYPDAIQLDDGRIFRPQFLQFLNTESLELTLYDQNFKLGEIVGQIQHIQGLAQARLHQIQRQSDALEP